MAKSPEDALATMVKNLKENTGKSLDEWATLAGNLGAAKHGEIVKGLKEKHGLTHGYANLVAQTFLDGQKPGGAAVGDDLVVAQYAGKKAGLKPVYDAVIAVVTTFGGDVDVSPKKTYVSLRRSKQFALIQPSTADRVDLGINLKGVAPKGRLEASGSFNAMVTHRVRLAAPRDVDAEVTGWLRAAYDAA